MKSISTAAAGLVAGTTPSGCIRVAASALDTNQIFDFVFRAVRGIQGWR
jgi:hypothetical protein